VAREQGNGTRDGFPDRRLPVGVPVAELDERDQFTRRRGKAVLQRGPPEILLGTVVVMDQVVAHAQFAREVPDRRAFVSVRREGAHGGFENGSPRLDPVGTYGATGLALPFCLRRPARRPTLPGIGHAVNSIIQNCPPVTFRVVGRDRRSAGIAWYSPAGVFRPGEADLLR
jgi:hypothetical protein